MYTARALKRGAAALLIGASLTWPAWWQAVRLGCRVLHVLGMPHPEVE